MFVPGDGGDGGEGEGNVLMVHLPNCSNGGVISLGECQAKGTV